MPNELTTKQIEEIAFAVLRSHNDDRLWRALTYESGPYDVTKATLALQDLAAAFFRAGLASAPAAPAQRQADERGDMAMREWHRECDDADTILRTLGLDPVNCRTDGGSLKTGMILDALQARDRMLKRAAPAAPAQAANEESR